MDAKISEDEMRRRLPVWIALSDLYLDNETQPYEYKHMARVCCASGYAREELRSILFDEVGPVFGHNLLQTAGQWGGWPADVVEGAMRRQVERPKTFPWLRRGFLTRYTADQWAVLASWLDKPREELEPSASPVDG